MDIDPKVEEALKRLGIELPGVADGLGKMRDSTDAVVKSATRQAIEQARAHRQLTDSIAKELRAQGVAIDQAKEMARVTADQIKVEEDATESAIKNQKIDDELAKKREEGVKKLLQNLQGLTTQSLSAISSFATSDKAFTGVVPTLELMGNVVKTVADAMGLMLSGISVFGFSLGKASEGLAKFVGIAADITVQVGKMQLEMSQAYLDSYNQISAVGLTLGGQLSKLSTSSKEAGMWINQYTGFVKNNIEALGTMGGTVQQSAERIGKLSASALKANDKLLVLYGGYDKAAGALAGWAKQVAAAGTDAATTQAYLTKNSTAYLTNLKALTELTGMSVEQAQKEQEEAQKDIAFRLKIRDLQIEDARNGTNKAQAVLDNELIMRRTYGAQAADLYKERIANDGRVISQSGLVYQSFFRAQSDIVNKVIETTGLETAARLRAISDITANGQALIDAQTANQRNIIKIGTYQGEEVTKAIVNGVRESLDTAGKREELPKAVASVLENLKKPLDQAGQDVALLLKNQTKAHQEMDDITAKNIADVAKMATALTGLTALLIEQFGGSSRLTGAITTTVESLLELKRRIDGTSMGDTKDKGYDWGKVGSAAKTYGTIGAIGGGTMALAGGITAPAAVATTALGGIGGSIVGGGTELFRQWYNKTFGSGDTGSADVGKLLKFQGGKTGDSLHYAGMNPDARAAFEKMIAEHGQPVKITSSYRSPEEQAAFYAAWLKAGGGPGNPTVTTPEFGSLTTPTPPGRTDPHGRGVALDLDRSDYEKLKTSGLLAKFGFRDVAGDPGHIQKMAKGGITNGVSIAGEEGPEAVIPLPDGRTIPIKMDTGKLIEKLDELLTVMIDNRDYSEKISRSVA
jgi:hypothetical protein